MKCFIVIFLASIALTKADENWPNLVSFEETERVLNENANSRIIKGEEATPHSFPYQAGMFLKVWGLENKTFCGGSIMTEYFILTAAHCVFNAYEGEVIVGAHKINEEEDTQQRFTTKVFIVHKGWDPRTLANDIAIVRVPSPIQFTDAVQPIKLPRESDKDKSFLFKTATMSGWGKTTNDATAISPVLNQMESKVLMLKFCNLFYFGRLGPNQMCVDGVHGRSVCGGDSGGPLVLPGKDGKPVQQGIVSFGIGFGCDKRWPQVFTRVASYVWWIYEHTGIAVVP